MAKKHTLKPADFRVGEFNSGVEGVEPITQAGTPVADGKLKAVREAAESAGVALVEAGDETTEAGE